MTPIEKLALLIGMASGIFSLYEALQKDWKKAIIAFVIAFACVFYGSNRWVKEINPEQALNRKPKVTEVETEPDTIVYHKRKPVIIEVEDTPYNYSPVNQGGQGFFKPEPDNTDLANMPAGSGIPQPESEVAKIVIKKPYCEEYNTGGVLFKNVTDKKAVLYFGKPGEIIGGNQTNIGPHQQVEVKVLPSAGYRYSVTYFDAINNYHMGNFKGNFFVTQCKTEPVDLVY